MSYFGEFNNFNLYCDNFSNPENDQIYNVFNQYDSYSQDNSFKDNISNVNYESKTTQPTLDKEPNKIKFKIEQKILGRKRKDSNGVGKHGKDSEDNIIIKIKSYVLKHLLIFINLLIYEIYDGNIDKGKYKKEIFKIKREQIINEKYNKQFIKKTLKDIFSGDISEKYSNYDSEHNKEVIEMLLNESDNEKKEKFQYLFSLTFLDCLNHFSGIKLLPILKGMNSLNDLCKKFENDQTYTNSLKHYALNFEKIIMEKKSRNRTKKKN